MFVDGSTPVPLKRRRHTYVDPMEVESAKAKLAAAKEKFGREIRVFETSALSSSPSVVSSSDEPDDFYEFTAEDYYRILATKKEDKFLKTKKIREAEEAARKSKFTKAVIRVRFPDNHTLEVNFHPSETMQSLVDFLKRVLSQPDLPFYLCKVHLDFTPWIFSMQLTVDSENDAVSLTIGHFADTTPPKKIIKDMSQDFFSASFIPGAIVYFSYDLPKGDDVVAANSGPFLHEDAMSLKGLEVIAEQPDPVQSAPEPATVIPPPVTQDPKPAEKKSVKPKWLKM